MSHRNSEPWLAVNLSFFFAGIGQIYAGKVKRGLLLLSVLIMLTVFALWQVFAPRGDVLVGAVTALIAVLFYVWNLFDAYYSTRKSNTDSYEESRKKSRDPWLAVFFTQVIPGAGHIYLRKNLTGLVLVGLYAVAYAFQQISIYIGLGAAAITAIAGFHAYFQAPERREQSRNPILVLTGVILLYGVLTTAIPHYVKSDLIRNFTTTSNGMAPAIYKEERFFVRPMPPREYQPGDVLVVELTRDTTWIYLRRLVATGGDLVEIQSDSTLYLNGQPVTGEDWTADGYVPEGEYAGPDDPFQVPENSVFLLADNSAGNRDSRHFGAVQRTNIIGKAYKIYWPLSRAGPVEQGVRNE